MSEHYILEGKNVVEVDFITWAKWFQNAKRTVKKETINDSNISTVFLGLNHNYEEGAPLIFETMVFGGALDGEMCRCSTYEEAERMHQKMADKVLAQQPMKVSEWKIY